MAAGPQDQDRSRPRKARYVPPPRADHRASPFEGHPPAADDEPPGVMWPDRGSGFEPSYYSPSGELLQGARFRRNLLRDPKGIGRAVRGSWGLWILAGGIVLIIVIALVSLVLS